MFANVLEVARELVRQRVSAGESVVDATAGNGKDTLFLARLVGERGNVFSFDIQEAALAKTRQLLRAHALEDRVTLIRAGHETLARWVSPPVAAVMFNLGYLPGGDKSITTTASTTIAALEQAFSLLKVGGIITVVVYWGHDTGKEEKAQLEAYLQRFDQREALVLRYEYVNQKNCPPFLFAVEKRAQGKNPRLSF
ncbi:class I SAM-dependent methyltransferase [Bacillaceae bacterium]